MAQVRKPGFIRSEKARPTTSYGVASGDITGTSAIVWSRTDRPARMIVDYDITESFRNPKRLISGDISDASVPPER